MFGKHQTVVNKLLLISVKLSNEFTLLQLDVKETMFTK